jgi:hypothetical protein
MAAVGNDKRSRSIFMIRPPWFYFLKYPNAIIPNPSPIIASFLGSSITVGWKASFDAVCLRCQ